MARLSPRHWQMLAWAGWASITWLSLTPVPPQPFTFNGVDKLEHAGAYLLVASCFLHAYPRARWPVALGLIAWGIVIEFLQGWSGYRYRDVWDMLANSSGVLLACWWARRT